MQVLSQGSGLSLLGSYNHNLPAGGEVEIVAPYDSVTKRLFANLYKDKITIIDISVPSNPDSIGVIDITQYGTLALNVAVKNNVVAVAVQGPTKQDSGKVVLFNTNGIYLSDVTVGAAPGMLVFTNDGERVVVANEGVPSDDYTNDPEGSISIVDLSLGLVNPSVNHVSFSAFNIGGALAGMFSSDIHVYGPGATRAQDLEPEFITLNNNGSKAYVSLQENNAVMVVDVLSVSVDTIYPLGYKDHSVSGNELDASDQDGGAVFNSWPVMGIYQPDGLAFYSQGGNNYFLTANEGASRKYTAFNEEERVQNMILNQSIFTNATQLMQNQNLGRLKISTSFGDYDQNAIMDTLFCYGGRSFSIWNADNGQLVYDSGNEFETIISTTYPSIFNSTGTFASFDTRSDNKGPEPEDVVVGSIGNRTFAFIGLEQVGGIMVYDITDPNIPQFVTYEPSEPGDVGPEASVFINSTQSPNGEPLLVVSNETSSTISIYEISNSLGEVRFDIAENVVVYPNPTNGKVTIDLEKLKDVTISVYDVTGRLVYNQNDINTTSHQFYLETIPGLYFIEILSIGFRHSILLVKE